MSVAHGDPVVTEAEFLHVQLVSSLLKRWLLGTHHGSVGSRHLREDFDEFGRDWLIVWYLGDPLVRLERGEGLFLRRRYQFVVRLCCPTASEFG